ncbi:MAG: GNAT family N-acetyltransferase [Actinomycetota bacterium]|nr:GNAT family N-acetyltransferase [Actinomycetota bacterium]
MQRWDRERASDVAAIVDLALPGEGLTEDDLVAVLWEDDDPTVVVATPDGAGVAAAVVHDVGRGSRVGFVQLVAVQPDGQRGGRGRALVEAIRHWAFDEQGCTALAVGGAAPFYLWPGVDVHATAALCLFESLGFVPRGAELNLAFPSRHRAPVPDGLELRRVLDEPDATAALAFVAAHWPNWVAETRRAVEHGSCHVAQSVTDGAIVGFGCHSVNRLGWLGPMGTDPARRLGGTGNALLGAIATDLMAAGLASVEVAWVGPVGFYVKAAGASTSRTFRTLSLSAPSA